MVRFEATIRNFGKQGEKTGWTYIELSEAVVLKLDPGTKQIFQVKGKLDDLEITKVSVMPMGDGKFILPLNADMRRKLRKMKGDSIAVALAVDKQPYQLAEDLVACLEDEPAAMVFFKTLPGSHQRYFSKWIESAKTEPTRVKRITMAVNALSRGLGHAEMIRSQKGTP
jgi:sugar phosphate isomerase/epimerase